MTKPSKRLKRRFGLLVCNTALRRLELIYSSRMSPTSSQTNISNESCSKTKHIPSAFSVAKTRFFFYLYTLKYLEGPFVMTKCDRHVNILTHFKNTTLYVGNCNKEQKLSKLSYDNFCSLLQLPTYNVAFLKCVSIHIIGYVTKDSSELPKTY